MMRKEYVAYIVVFYNYQSTQPFVNAKQGQKLKNLNTNRICTSENSKL